jgi:tryptophan 2,3-dioxygenase
MSGTQPTGDSTRESPALWFALGAAAALAPMVIHGVSGLLFGSNKCPFKTSSASTGSTGAPIEAVAGSNLPPTAAHVGCPYLASQGEDIPPIDMKRFYHANHTKKSDSNSTNTSQTNLDRTGSSTSTTSLPGFHAPNTNKPKKGKDPVHYHTYLDLDNILSAQKPISWQEGGTHAHDEHLFIVTHQASELWFKQLLHDLLSIINIMSAPYISENSMAVVLERLTRICKIQNLLIEHLHVLQTMTPLSFLDFRDYLYPASGFQSMQFRQVESLLGLTRSQRLSYAGDDYDVVLLPEQKEHMKQIEQTVPNLFSLIDKWLARNPLLESDGYNFWDAYHTSVFKMLEEQEETFRQQYYVDKAINKQRFDAEIVNINSQKAFFTTFFNEEEYNKLVAATFGVNGTKGTTVLSYKAVQAATMINVYQHLTLFAPAFQLLILLQEIDSNFAKWRSAHASMVLRMIGGKMGTGGSSGWGYLNDTINKHRIFKQLSDLSSLVIPRPYLPALPDHVIRSSSFFPEDFASRSGSGSPKSTTALFELKGNEVQMVVYNNTDMNNTELQIVNNNVLPLNSSNSNIIFDVENDQNFEKNKTPSPTQLDRSSSMPDIDVDNNSSHDSNHNNHQDVLMVSTNETVLVHNVD